MQTRIDLTKLNDQIIDFGESHIPKEIQELAHSEKSSEENKVPDILTFENNSLQVFGSVKIEKPTINLT